MVYKLEEFAEVNTNARFLNYWNKLPNWLHKMSVQEINAHISRNGKTKEVYQRKAIKDYLSWLNKNYKDEIDVDLTELYFKLSHGSTEQNKEQDNDFIGFFSLEELKQSFETNLQLIENYGGVYSNYDYSGFKAVCFLEWYGVKTSSIPSIMLTNVSCDGHTVYIPAENREIYIDDNIVANYFSEYKYKTGYISTDNKMRNYQQNNFIRSTKNCKIGIRHIYLTRNRFFNTCEDKRFEKNRIYLSGRYKVLLDREEELVEGYKAQDEKTIEIFKEVFNETSVKSSLIYYRLRDYNNYKKMLFSTED